MTTRFDWARDKLNGQGVLTPISYSQAARIFQLFYNIAPDDHASILKAASAAFGCDMSEAVQEGAGSMQSTRGTLLGSLRPLINKHDDSRGTLAAAVVAMVKAL